MDHASTAFFSPFCSPGGWAVTTGRAGYSATPNRLPSGVVAVGRSGHGEGVQRGGDDRMTYFWSAVGVVLVLGIGLIVGGSLSGPARSGRDVSARRSVQMQVGAVMVGVSLCVLVIAYFTADWP